MPSRSDIESSFAKYVPAEFAGYVADLFFSQKIRFKVSRSRKTKLGDYRSPHRDGVPHAITVNHDLNPYSFLITTLHEFAHMNTFIKYGNRVKPHGDEWKAEFRALLAPLLRHEAIPQDIRAVLNKSYFNLKASSCTDAALLRVLKKYDNKSQQNLVHVEDLPLNAAFKLSDRTFERGIKRRTRYLCKEVPSGKMYLVNGLAEVEPLNRTENNEPK
jgi:SprT protein